MTRITLIALTPTGETLLVRQGEVTRMVQPPEFGGNRTLTEEEAESAIRHLDLTRVDRTFDGWDNLNRFVQKTAAKVPRRDGGKGPLKLDVACEQLKVAERWLAQGRLQDASRTAVRLLGEDVVLQDPEARTRARAILSACHDAPPRASGSSTLHDRARHKWEAVRLNPAA